VENLIVLVAIMFGAFLILRGFVLWYFRINEHLRNQRKIISLLEIVSADISGSTASNPRLEKK